MTTPTKPMTSARDEILRAVHAALPPGVAAPTPRGEAIAPPPTGEALRTRFTHAAVAAGALVVTAAGDPAVEAKAACVDAIEVLSLLPGLTSTIDEPTDPHALATLDLFICKASLGVAESGAVWFATSNPIHRAALFIAQRVVIVIAADAIVSDLHEAYALLDIRANSFGTFVSGPSKTADIEQSLVVGAHGPKELTVIIGSV